MRIILKEDIVSLGVAGDIVSVADGYARNYLLPKKLAVLATKGNLKELEFKKESLAKEEKKKREGALKIASELEGKTITFVAKAGEEGRLYGSVTPHDVANTIEKQLEKTIDRRKIALPGTVKEVGTYQIAIKVYPEVEAKISLEVYSEEHGELEQNQSDGKDQKQKTKKEQELKEGTTRKGESGESSQ